MHIVRHGGERQKDGGEGGGRDGQGSGRGELRACVAEHDSISFLLRILNNIFDMLSMMSKSWHMLIYQ
jgi:hypothetical protein